MSHYHDLLILFNPKSVNKSDSDSVSKPFFTTLLPNARIICVDQAYTDSDIKRVDGVERVRGYYTEPHIIQYLLKLIRVRTGYVIIHSYKDSIHSVKQFFKLYDVVENRSTLFGFIPFCVDVQNPTKYELHTPLFFDKNDDIIQYGFTTSVIKAVDWVKVFNTLERFQHFRTFSS